MNTIKSKCQHQTCVAESVNAHTLKIGLDIVESICICKLSLLGKNVYLI